MDFIPLHAVPRYFDECAEVLNEEWKRSLAARLHSLKKSCDTFPICLVLLEKKETNGWTVVGHSRLSHVQGQTVKSCLVESVVVRKSHRGKGYGRIVMEKTEEFAASKGYKTMYLTTHDKQDFYQHLGYDFCSPIVCFDSAVVPEHLAQKLLGNMQITRDRDSAKDDPQKADGDGKTAQDKGTEMAENKPPVHKTSEAQHQNPSLNLNNSAPPPAPPPPQVPPPPVAPPPPPVPSSVPGMEKKAGLDDKTVTRWDPKLVSWMKKVLAD